MYAVEVILRSVILLDHQTVVVRTEFHYNCLNLTTAFVVARSQIIFQKTSLLPLCLSQVILEFVIFLCLHDVLLF